MTFGSLFAGIGGLDLGLERAGMECKWQVEDNDYARQVLEKHWPNVPRFADICDVGGRDLEPVDLICGGFPCQDISLAGRGDGLEGARSGLFFELWRIVCNLRPRFVVMENVPALRSRGLDRVLGEMAAGGYDAEWDCIPAAAVGAPHRRDRIFIVGRLHGDTNSDGKPGLSEHAKASGRATNAPNTDRVGRKEQQSHIPDERGPKGSRLGRELAFEPGKAPPALCGMDDGVSHRVDRLRCLGNAVVPQVAEWIGRRIMVASE